MMTPNGATPPGGAGLEPEVRAAGGRDDPERRDPPGWRGPGLGPGARRRLLLATGNRHKAEELSVILGDRFDVVAVAVDVEETGETFEDNALLKARALRDATGELAVADDSGIEVDALDGGPGVRSARWAAGDEVGRLRAALEGVPEERRGCRYVCAAAVARPDGSDDVVRGTVSGRVATAPRGSGGFGYDPLVVPDEGDGRTFAEMAPAEKHAISHRARAFRALAERL